MWGIALSLAGFLWNNRQAIIDAVETYGPTAVKLAAEYGPQVKSELDRLKPQIDALVASGKTLEQAVMQIVAGSVVAAIVKNSEFTPQDKRFDQSSLSNK